MDEANYPDPGQQVAALPEMWALSRGVAADAGVFLLSFLLDERQRERRRKKKGRQRRGCLLLRRGGGGRQPFEPSDLQRSLTYLVCVGFLVLCEAAQQQRRIKRDPHESRHTNRTWRRRQRPTCARALSHAKASLRILARTATTPTPPLPPPPLLLLFCKRNIFAKE
jgi:hypothetical protein